MFEKIVSKIKGGKGFNVFDGLPFECVVKQPGCKAAPAKTGVDYDPADIQDFFVDEFELCRSALGFCKNVFCGKVSGFQVWNW